MPTTFRAPEPLPPAQAESFADLKWFEVFKDEKLQELVRTALAHNYDYVRPGCHFIIFGAALDHKTGPGRQIRYRIEALGMPRSQKKPCFAKVRPKPYSTQHLDQYLLLARMRASGHDKVPVCGW